MIGVLRRHQESNLDAQKGPGLKPGGIPFSACRLGNTINRRIKKVLLLLLKQRS